MVSQRDFRVPAVAVVEHLPTMRLTLRCNQALKERAACMGWTGSQVVCHRLATSLLHRQELQVVPVVFD